MRNLSGHQAIINCMSLNKANVLVTGIPYLNLSLWIIGADNGSLHFWDWKSGYNFQKIQSKVQPGSISAEGGIFASTFDHSGIRLITGECDKTIKVWKEDEESTEFTHPVDDIRLEFNHRF
jgi:pleiotropic regulator 1